MARFPNDVLYRLPMTIGAALALSLAAPAFAQDPPPATASTQKTATPENADSALPGERTASETIVVTGGAVRERSNAQWTEDMSLPELPTAPDDGPAGK